EEKLRGPSASKRADELLDPSVSRETGHRETSSRDQRAPSCTAGLHEQAARCRGPLPDRAAQLQLREQTAGSQKSVSQVQPPTACRRADERRLSIDSAQKRLAHTRDPERR